MTAIALNRLFTQASHAASREQTREVIPMASREAATRASAREVRGNQAVAGDAVVGQRSARLSVDLRRAEQALPATPNVSGGVLTAVPVASSAVGAVGAASADLSLDPRTLTPELRVAVQMMQLLSGKKFELFALDYLAQTDAGTTLVYNPQAQLSGANPDSAAAADNTPVLVIEQISERQMMQYAARGEVTLGDGRQQAFSVSLMMASEHRQWQMTASTAGAMKDPLVLNLGGGGASLTSQTQLLDLDADGEQERVAMLGRQSFYLVLDDNQNGVADDGRELFGALSGDGFADLAALDEDGNGFVDQADAAFSQLRLWQPQSEQWLTLAEVDVIALYVGSENTPFLLKNSEMELLGAVRSTGFFLRSEGPAGTMQQLDLVV